MEINTVREAWLYMGKQFENETNPRSYICNFIYVLNTSKRIKNALFKSIRREAKRRGIDSNLGGVAFWEGNDRKSRMEFCYKRAKACKS